MKKISVQGALCGAVVGAVGRGLVVWLNTGVPVFMLMLPSAGIGALVGLIAGSFRHPVTAAAVGAVLSGVIFEFFMFACASMIDWFDRDAAHAFLSHTVIYAAEMALAGALAGISGSVVGRYDADQHSRDD